MIIAPAAQQQLDMPMPFARIKGELMTELPADLFIPPEALSVILEQFEGPLDLLLYLIRHHSLDILDIPMADLTRQYMAYVEAMHQHQLELAGDYLLMAAVLIEIKSRMLLPRPPKQSEHEPEDPRAELVRRLLEYEQMKAAAHQLDSLPQSGRDYSLVDVLIEKDFGARQPQVRMSDLAEAWRILLSRAKVNQHHKITREQLSVRAHMSRILRSLQGRGYSEFGELFDASQGIAVMVVSFLAVLELARETLIELTQSAAFEPIYVKLCVSEAPVIQLEADNPPDTAISQL